MQEKTSLLQSVMSIIKESVPEYKIIGDQQLKEFIVFCGGDGETIQLETDLALKINNALGIPVCIFNYIGGEDGEFVPYKNTYSHLESLLEELIKKYHIKRFHLVSTSMGAASMTYVISLNKYPVHNAIYLDPVDYYQDDKLDSKIAHLSWRGSEEFKPKGHLVSELLHNVSSKTLRVSLVEFQLRNCTKESYIEEEYSRRGLDYENGYPRHNSQMKKGFFYNTPNENRNRHIENCTIPHGLFRDGDVEKNYNEIVEILKSIFN